MEDGITIQGLREVDTSYPRLQNGAYKVRFSAGELKLNKKKTGNVLKIKLLLEQDATDTKGRAVHPGFVLTTNVSLARTESYDPAQAVALLQECFLGERNAEDKLVVGDLQGKEGLVRVTVKEDSEFGERNEVRFVPRADSPASA